MNVRRVVTGHDPSGKSVFVSDDEVAPIETMLMPGFENHLLWGGDEPVREINGLAVFAARTFSGCRAMSPSELKAAVEYAGQRYTFVSGTALGCQGIWGVGDEAFLGLISGLRPAR